MAKNMCRLYDEELVRSIMVATGLSVFEYIKKRQECNPDDICSFIESHARAIIDDTITDMNDLDEAGTDEAIDEDSWPDTEADS